MSWGNFDSSSMQSSGGFMDTTMGDGAGAGTEDKGGSKRAQNCMPVMISHIQRHGEKLTVWGMPALIVTLVAFVRKLESTSTKVTFEFQDETGVIKGIKWLEGDNATYESPVSVNNYARVYGLIRDQNDEPYVLIVNVQPMEHLNELLTHIMEVTLMCLQGEKMVNKVATNDSSYANNSIRNTSANGTAGNTSMGGGGGGGMGSGLTENQQLILQIIQNSDPEYGAERDAIKQRVPPHLVSRVDEIIEFLSGEGHIYTTKTDDFFKAI
ncbi:replication protein A 32 kDa subunit-B [Copidosoma floridanum]|uniref:replication protein A 32 kDa subunit-B n=1 Tax=Copidosoma floridanum TaxID=29053 RepID=UPI0006C9DBE2|nr:replication protein A 32 kDa subunit-B [Copidosoma floridanum]